MYKITTDCIGCGSCVDECPEKAILPQGDTYLILPEKCTQCGNCSNVCPVEAIIEE